jgi:uncharacterized protein YcbK (DUF882 family)
VIRELARAWAVWNDSTMAASIWTRRRFATTVLASAVAVPFASVLPANEPAGPDGQPASSQSNAQGASPALAQPEPASAASQALSAAERWIELVNTHTSEVVSVAFANTSGFVPTALQRLQHLLRDYRVDEQHAMDPGLYLQLADLAHAAGREPRFEVISGYRSPTTNAMLRTRGHGVAEHSLHLQGRAIDVRLKGCKCSTLRDLALSAGRGGVGYYARSDFVHIDTGRVRSWQG